MLTKYKLSHSSCKVVPKSKFVSLVGKNGEYKSAR